MSKDAKVRPPASARRPVVAVLGSGKEAVGPRCAAVGEGIARLGAHLLTGGGGGVMAAVAEAFCGTPGRRGLSLAVLPGDPRTGLPPEGYPNPWVEVPLPTHLPGRGTRGGDPCSRNHLVVLGARAIVALPGGEGTASECRLALRYGRPIFAWLDRPADIPGFSAGIPIVSGFDELRLRLEEILRQDQDWSSRPFPSGSVT